jgi:hypothetical protein
MSKYQCVYCQLILLFSNVYMIGLDGVHKLDRNLNIIQSPFIPMPITGISGNQQRSIVFIDGSMFT